jgi:four helix bundle protein
MEHESQNSKKYDLEDRTLVFARNIRDFVRDLKKTTANSEYIGQLIRSSSSVGANYIEANDSLGKKDFAMRIKICRKEAKEARFWLRLVEVEDDSNTDTLRKALEQEATELMNIFGAILKKCE